MAEPLVARFVLNGKQVTLQGESNATVPLVITLRNELQLTGTKLVCGQGNCGACTIHVSFPPADPQQPREIVVLNSCLFPTGALLVPASTTDNAKLVHVTTVEGVVDYSKPNQPGTKLATAIAECNGSQCGFCTPGMVMKSLQCVDKDGNLCQGCTLQDVEDILNGNLCRCTGYRPILYAMKSTMIPRDPQVQQELIETPPCVGRGLDGNYTKNYANGGLTSKNVLQPNPLKTAPAAKTTHAQPPAHEPPTHEQSEEAPVQVHLASAAPVATAATAAPHSVKAVSPALKQHFSDEASAPQDRFYDQRHRIRFSQEERPQPAHPSTPHYLDGASKWCNYYSDELHAPYLGDHDQPEHRPAFHATRRVGAHSIAHKDGTWSVPITFNDLIAALRDAMNRSVPARLVAGNVNSSFQPITLLPENTAFISLDKMGSQPIPVPPYSVIPMSGVGIVNNTLALGSLLTIARLIEFLQTDPTLKDRPQIQAVVDHLLTVGNIQIRNRSTVVGNLVAARNRAAATDLGLILQALGGQVLVGGPPTYQPPRSFPVLDYLNQPPTSLDYTVVVGVTVPLSAMPTTLSFRRVGTRVENHPTLCSVSYYSQSAQNPSYFSGFTGVPVKNAGTGATVPVTGIPLGTVASGEEAVKKLDAVIRTIYPTLALDGRRLIVNLTASVAILTMPKQTMLQERKTQGSKGSQRFFVQPNASPVTEPIIKPACYDQAAGAAIYTQDVRPPSGNLHITFVQSPCAVVQFSLAAWKAKGDELLSDTGATFLTAKQIADALPTPPNFPANASDDLRVVACNVTVNDWKGNLKSDAPPPTLQYPTIGGFGEFILAPGFTVYAGQTIAMVLHPDLAESRRLAGIVQGYVAQDVVKPTPEVFFNRSQTLAVMNVAQSRSQTVEQRPYNRNQALNLGDIIIARGKEAQYVGADGQKAWNAQWAAWAKDPSLTVVDQFDTTYQTPPPVTAASQTHMYLETQSAMCKMEEGRYIINASTQSSMTTAARVGKALGIQSKDISVSHNRVGGGFGGKEPQSFPTAIAAAAACKTVQAPVSIQLDRQVDMEMMGKRHAVEGRYRIAVEIATGKIKALELLYDGDAGSSSDCSEPVLELASLSSDNMYWVENYRCTARPWFTHKQTGTAFRSFGVVQAMTITEAAIDHAYFALVQKKGKAAPTADDFRRLNFYTTQNGHNVTPQRLNPYVSPPAFNLFGQKLTETDFGAGAWKQLTDPNARQPYQEKSYPATCKDVEVFNSSNQWRKQGIALMPLRYGISFTYYPMNQGNSTVQIYNVDGSVLVKQGGVEMGQGIQVKCLQNAAAALNAPFSYFRTAPHSTDNTPNAMDTGASTGSDLNVPAVLDAATQLRLRLEKGMNITSFGVVSKWIAAGSLPSSVKEAWDAAKTEWNQKHKEWPRIVAFAKTMVNDPQAGLSAKYLVNGCSWNSQDAPSWRGVVANAFQLRIPLIAVGYSVPEGDDGKPLDGVNVFYYYNYAAAWSAVEVDLVTGEVDVLRTDIAYDVGESTNPAVDVGQIEGAFVQGVGNMLTESVTYDPSTGRLNERSIMQYAIPDHRTIPRDLNVFLYWPTGGSALQPLPPDQQGKLPQKQMSRSKTTGEPPLVLSVTVMMAVRRAIVAGKKQLFPSDPNTFVTLSTPLVPKAVLQALYGTRTVIDAKGY